jgi:hypothetical protein
MPERNLKWVQSAFFNKLESWNFVEREGEIRLGYMGEERRILQCEVMEMGISWRLKKLWSWDPLLAYPDPYLPDPLLFFIIISQFWKNKILVCTLYEVFIDLFYFESCMNEFSWLKMIFLAKIKKILVVFCFYLDSFSFNFFNTINWSFISLTSGSTLRSSQTIWILKNV